MIEYFIAYLGIGFIITFFIWLMVDGKFLWWEPFNPAANYYHFKVNWFGAIIISLIWTILCPIGAVVYWFCWLCIIGRKD